MGPKARRKAAVDAAMEILNRVKAAGRDLTPLERRQLDSFEAEVKECDKLIEAAKADEELFAAFKSPTPFDEYDPTDPDTPSPANHDAPHRLSFGNTKAAEGVVKLARRFGNMGVKSLLTAGTSATMPADLFPGDIAEIGKPATSLFDIIPAKKIEDGDAFAYLRQASRTNNAAPVARGATKPKSTATVERITGNLSVVAHIMEDIHVYDLEDSAALGDFVRTEMGWGLQEAVAGQIVNGDGTAPNLRGIANVSGIHTQEMVTNATVTVRRALGRLDAVGYTAAGVLMNPSDWEAIETAQLTDGSFLLGQGANGAPLDTVERRLWGARVALAAQVPVGKAIVVGNGAATILHDGKVKLDWDASTGFDTNTMRARCEGRFGLAVMRPDAIVWASLTA